MTAKEERIFHSINSLAEEIRAILFATGNEFDGMCADDPTKELLAKINRASYLCQATYDLACGLISRVDALEEASLQASE